MDSATTYSNAVRIGYARVSGQRQDHQLQLDALNAAGCREVIVETASTRGERPKLRAALNTLQAGDTLVIYKPDRVARSMKELLVVLEDQLHARGINLHILTGICAGVHQPDSASIADKMLFMVAAMAAEMERDLIRERTLDGLAAAAAQGRTGGRPAALDPDTLAVALARRARGESVTAIAAHLGVGRSTLYRALQPEQEQTVASPAPALAPAHPPPPEVTTPAGTTPAAVSEGLRPIRARIRQPGEPSSERERALQERLASQRAAMRAAACPTCGDQPLDVHSRRRQRHDLAATWLYPDPASQLRVIERVHCAACQPHQRVATVVCELCGDGPLLVNDLAAAATDELAPAVVRTWLVTHGWALSPRLLCPDHPHPPAEPRRKVVTGQSSSSGSSGASGPRSGRRPLPVTGR
ncbi:recombinase family protein [uncultured Pseudonocardia sp.]|uniref:recombinase family protein n=1 Tax=uncultured Pseudonocardia sp. TaxID=211455 RepID=UPI00260C6076|nr:recombinase family protein [uncultured Pseudonocardia sp.]